VNIQEYISSGIIESYVLGLADAAERAEFERMLAENPEVREAMRQFEMSLEKHSVSSAITPPPQLKSKILSTIDMESGHRTSPGRTGGSGSPPVIAVNDEFRRGKPRAGVMTIKKDYSRVLAAASVILLLISTALNFYFFSRYKEYNERYQALIASQTELASHNQILQTRLLEYEKAVEMMKDPNMYIVKMQAMPSSPDPASATTVYWDTRTKDVYLTINKLPVPSPDQQYQLWALVDGKPVDAGVFDIKEGAGMTKMKNIPRAEAFAVTLEKRGGSPTPSMDKMMVMGKV
jgi:anti-sigma-K factor RskA